MYFVIHPIRLLLSQKPNAKTLVLVPTIALAGQHCTAYEKAGFGKQARPATMSGSGEYSHHRVDWFCSDRQVGTGRMFHHTWRRCPHIF